MGRMVSAPAARMRGMPADRTPYFLCREVSTSRTANWVQGPRGVEMEMESQLTLTGPDFLFRGTDGAVHFEARTARGLSFWRPLLYDVQKDGKGVARVFGAVLPFVNPIRRIEVPGAEPWAAWRGLVGGAISVTRRGAEFLHIGAPVVERTLFRTRETRDLFVDGEEDVPLLLALSILLVRPSGA